MNYGDLIKRGWRITWNNKFLWILGFLAALGGNSRGGGGGNNFRYNSSSPGSSTNPFGDFGNFDPDPALIGSIITGAAVLVGCLFLFALIMWLVRLIAEAGLIQAVADIEDGVKTNFSKAFADGRTHFGRMFGVAFLLNLPIIILAGIMLCIGLTLASTAMQGGNPETMGPSIGGFVVIFGCIACLMFPYLLVISFIYPFAQRGVVLRGLGVMDSIRHGWDFLKNNFVELLLLAVIFIAIGIGVGIASLVVILPILAVTMGPGIFRFASNQSVSPEFLVLGGVGVLAVLVVSALINSVLVTFRSSTFTLAYRELMGKSKAAAT